MEENLSEQVLKERFIEAQKMDDKKLANVMLTAPYSFSI